MSRLGIEARIAVACAAFGAVTLACDSYEGVTLEATTTAPLAASVDETAVNMPAGVAIAVRVVAQGTSDPENDQPVIDLSTGNADVLGVAPTLEEGVFVLYGVAPGSTSIKVRVEGHDDETVPVTVTPQGDHDG
jgi:hypothetical protein